MMCESPHIHWLGCVEDAGHINAPHALISLQPGSGRMLSCEHLRRSHCFRLMQTVVHPETAVKEFTYA